ncbi:hypothetical protein MMC12_008676, partial [Toensbergia leucococca]|nr:hypothetical protein [Toensbergia leucococca]
GNDTMERCRGAAAALAAVQQKPTSYAHNWAATTLITSSIARQDVLSSPLPGVDVAFRTRCDNRRSSGKLSNRYPLRIYRM